MKNLNSCSLLLPKLGNALLFCWMFACGGCGYRWEGDSPLGRRPTIAIPQISGDEEGGLTRAVTWAIATSGVAEVVSRDGDYRLEVVLGGGETETIGYRRDPQKVAGKVRKNLLAAEERRSLVVEVTLYEGTSGRIALGPYKIAADAEYDFIDGDSLQDLVFLNAQGEPVKVLPFSLGQLEPKEAAHQAAARPLYRRIARKIVDALGSAW